MNRFSKVKDLKAVLERLTNKTCNIEKKDIPFSYLELPSKIREIFIDADDDVYVKSTSGYSVPLCLGREDEILRVYKAVIDCVEPQPTYMTAQEIIRRLRSAIDSIYENYEGHPLIEEDDIMEAFEEIVSDYHEDISQM